MEVGLNGTKLIGIFGPTFWDNSVVRRLKQLYNTVNNMLQKSRWPFDLEQTVHFINSHIIRSVCTIFKGRNTACFILLLAKVSLYNCIYIY